MSDTKISYNKYITKVSYQKSNNFTIIKSHKVLINNDIQKIANINR